MRIALPIVLLLLAVAAPAQAAVTLGGRPDGLLALAASDGLAYAVVPSGDPQRPFRLVRSSGRGASPLATFGVAGAEFPDVAAGPGGALAVSWGRTSAAGAAYGVS